MRYSIILLFLAINLYSQDCITINHVFDFKPGEGQNLGQSEQFYPANILGIPSRIAQEEVAEASESEILSLGFGGEIIVGNTDNLIIDGEGADFTIFENVFLNPITQKLFKEPAVVSVSKDNINYVEFPYDLTTLEGCAGTHITNGAADYCDANLSGGDSFDLSQIGIDSVRYIKIKDLTIKIKDNPSHPYYDFSLSGFDLDAVVIHNYTKSSISAITERHYPNYRISGSNVVSHSSQNLITVYDLNGSIMREFRGVGSFDLSTLAKGMYLITIKNNSRTQLEKIINL
jgi:hypothetical protein